MVEKETGSVLARCRGVHGGVRAQPGVRVIADDDRPLSERHELSPGLVFELDDAADAAGRPLLGVSRGAREGMIPTNKELVIAKTNPNL